MGLAPPQQPTRTNGAAQRRRGSARPKPLYLPHLWCVSNSQECKGEASQQRKALTARPVCDGACPAPAAHPNQWRRPAPQGQRAAEAEIPATPLVCRQHIEVQGGSDQHRKAG